MPREFSREDMQHELRLTISDVLRQEVADFSLTVQRNLKHEFRCFFEECRSNGLVVSEWRESRSADSDLRSASRAGSSDQSRPPIFVEDAEESSAALRISSSLFMSPSMERRVSSMSKMRTGKTRSARGSVVSERSRVSLISNAEITEAAQALEFEYVPDAPKPARISAKVQPPEQGPPAMLQPVYSGGMTHQISSNLLDPLAENPQELAATHPLGVPDARKQADGTRHGDHESRGSRFMPGSLSEEADGDFSGSREEAAWESQVGVPKVRNNHHDMASSNGSKNLQVQQMANARARAAQTEDNDSVKMYSASESSDSPRETRQVNFEEPSTSSRGKGFTFQTKTRGSTRLALNAARHPTRTTIAKWFRLRPRLPKLSMARWTQRGTQRATGVSDTKAVRNARRTSIPFDADGSIDSHKFGSFDTLTWSSIPRNKCIADIVNSEWFDYVMGVFLISNAILIGVQVDNMAHSNSTEVPVPFRVSETCFCAIFTLELALRVFVCRWHFFHMKGWQWNMFDSAVVSFQILDEITKFALTGTKVQGVIDEFGVLRMLRLARIARLIRMVRLIPELKSMVYLISASMWSFFWTVVLLVLLMYCFAVYYTELATDLGNEEQISDAAKEKISTHWGSVASSIFSLYQAITGGDDWVNFVQVLDVPRSNYAANSLVFCLYMAFTSMVMLNLVTGVFVEGAQRIIREDKDTELIKQVRKLFQMADSDNSNEITWEEFKGQMENRAMDEYFKAVDLSRKEAKDLFKLLDVDQSGSISVEEFVKGCLRLRGPARSVDLAALVYDANLKHCSIKKHVGFMESKLDTISEHICRTCNFLDSILQFGSHGSQATDTDGLDGQLV